MSKFISKTVEIVFYILLALIILAFAVSVGDMISAGIIGDLATVALIFMSALFVYFGKNILGFLQAKVLKPVAKLSVKQMFFILGGVILVTKFFFLFLLDVDSTLHYDMSMYHSFANQIASTGEIVENATYAIKHTYTAVYGLILSPFAKLFGSDPKVLTGVLTVSTTIVSLLLFDIIRKPVGKNIAFCGILLYNLLPMGLFQTQLLVHETALLFFHILALWLLLKSFEPNRHFVVKILLIVLASVSIAVGKRVNAAGSVVLIALCIISFLKIIGSKITFKKLVQFVCFLLVFLVIFSMVSSLLTTVVKGMIVNSEQESNELKAKRVRYGWSIYLGLNYEYSGLINKEDADTYHAYLGIEDPEEAKAYQIDLIQGRIDEYLQSPIKIPLHIFNKIKVLWGSLWLPFPYAQGNAVESFILNGCGGIIYKGLYMANALVYLFVLSMILVAIRKKNSETDSDLTGTHCKMIIVGLTAALICFEVCPKYASHTQILFYTIWMLQLKRFAANSGAIREKIRTKLLKKNP